MGRYQATGDAPVGTLDYGPYPAVVRAFAPTYKILIEPIGASPFPIPSGSNVFLYASASAGADFIANLPAATGSGFSVIVEKADNNAHNVIVTPNGTDTINGVNAAIPIVGAAGQYADIRLIDSATGAWSLW